MYGSDYMHSQSFIGFYHLKFLKNYSYPLWHINQTPLWLLL